MLHYSVLLNESIAGLQIKEDGIYVDATLGYAGHSSKILEQIPKGFLYAFDQDQEAISYSKQVLKNVGSNFKVIHQNFVHLKKCLQEDQITKIDGILFDLGLSSPQIDDASRGFSFMNDGNLDMRMNQDEKLSAYDVVNTYSVEELSQIFYDYGEESHSSQIAKMIVQERTKQKIKTTTELTQVIKKAVGANYFFKHHPEREIFQAIRIEVNQELQVLEQVLPDAISLLKPGGRMCVITFHSLEDRIVKKIFKRYSEVDELVKGLPDIPKEFQPTIKIINRKPIVASANEIKENSRSKSAKLRIIERI